MAVLPNEADPPLVIDPNGVLPLPIAAQCLQLIPRRGGKHSQFRGGVKLQKLPQRDSLEGAESPRMLIVKKLLSILRAKALNHSRSIERITLYVKRITSRGVGGTRLRR